MQLKLAKMRENMNITIISDEPSARPSMFKITEKSISIDSPSEGEHEGTQKSMAVDIQESSNVYSNYKENIDKTPNRDESSSDKSSIDPKATPCRSKKSIPDPVSESKLIIEEWGNQDSDEKGNPDLEAALSIGKSHKINSRMHPEFSSDSESKMGIGINFNDIIDTDKENINVNASLPHTYEVTQPEQKSFSNKLKSSPLRDTSIISHHSQVHSVMIGEKNSQRFEASNISKISDLKKKPATCKKVETMHKHGLSDLSPLISQKVSKPLDAVIKPSDRKRKHKNKPISDKQFLRSHSRRKVQFEYKRKKANEKYRRKLEEFTKKTMPNPQTSMTQSMPSLTGVRSNKRAKLLLLNQGGQ